MSTGKTKKYVAAVEGGNVEVAEVIVVGEGSTKKTSKVTKVSKVTKEEKTEKSTKADKPTKATKVTKVEKAEKPAKTTKTTKAKKAEVTPVEKDNSKKKSKSKTELERTVFIIQTLIDNLDIEDDEIKRALKPHARELPRGFPVAWGGVQKHVRQPGQPKKPLNGYIFFTKKFRETVITTNPGISNKEVMSKLAQLWKETPDEEKVEFNDLAAADKVRYAKELEEAKNKTEVVEAAEAAEAAEVVEETD